MKFNYHFGHILPFKIKYFKELQIKKNRQLDRTYYVILPFPLSIKNKPLSLLPLR